MADGADATEHETTVPASRPRADDGGGARYEASVDRSIDRAQQTARWALAAFGGVAAVLAAGIQLSNLGGIPEHQRVIAVVGASIGLSGVFTAIAAVVWIQRPVETSIFDFLNRRDLRLYVKRFDADPILLGGRFDSLKAFIEDYRERVTLFTAAQRTEEDEGASADTRATVDRLTPILVERSRMALIVIENARNFYFRRRFRYGVIAIFGGAVMTVVGLLIFSVNSSTPAAHSTPVADVVVHLSPNGQSVLRPLLGDRCVTRPVRARDRR